MNQPQFVGIVRQIIPTTGVQTDKPARIKNKVRKALDKSGIGSETIRGVGRRLGNFALVYEEKEGKLFANFQKYDALQLAAPKRKSRSSKGKESPILTGVHPQCAEHTSRTFATAVVEALPEDWILADAPAYRWISTDVGFLLNTRHTVEDAAAYIINQAQTLLPSVGQYYYTLMFVNEHYILGIGPA